MADRSGHQQQGDLLELSDNEEPFYSSGQRPPISDERMLHDYDMETAGQPRISTSHDEFVGSAQPYPPTTGLPGGPGYVVPSNSAAPAPPGQLFDGGKNYSQTSGLGNYQRYSDMDNDSEAGAGGYYAAGGGIDEDSVPGLPLNKKAKHRSRNSILSMGGGITGRVKSALGMGPEYSEMDLPLTEQGVQRAESDNSGSSQPPQRKTPGSKFKFGIPGRSKPDPSTLGPRIIHLNNPPANAANKYVDNHVSTAKYNFATIIPKFLFEQFSKYANSSSCSLQSCSRFRMSALRTAGLQLCPWQSCCWFRLEKKSWKIIGGRARISN